MAAVAPKPHQESRKRVSTYRDLLRIPWDGKRREILEGELEVVASPYPYHQDVLSNVNDAVRPHVKRHALGKVYFAAVDVVLSEINVCVPDFLFISRERLKLITKKNISGGVPDLVVEVVSESHPARDTSRKRGIYERFGVPNYWLLFPDERVLEELVLEQGRYVQRSIIKGNKKFRPAVFPGLAIDLRKIWVR